MLKICAWHPKPAGQPQFEFVIGEVPPYDNPARTHGICPDCTKTVLDDPRTQEIAAAAAIRTE